MNPTNRTELIREITRVGFYMDDLRLFLDTHPADRAAIAEFNRCAHQKHELVMLYTEKYGPFDWYGMNDDPNDWNWVTYPWPWEGACD